jgi:hypothetical protein
MSPGSTFTSGINPYNAGVAISLTTLVDIHNIESHGNPLNVHVEHVFLPFTKSQTMRIRIPPSSSAGSSTLPDIPEGVAVLKLYDRRWIDDRKFDDEPWSPAREEAAQARWKAIASGELVDDFDRLNPDDYTPSHEEEQYRRLCKVRLIFSIIHSFCYGFSFVNFRNALKPNMKHIGVYRVYRV